MAKYVIDAGLRALGVAWDVLTYALPLSYIPTALWLDTINLSVTILLLGIVFSGLHACLSFVTCGRLGAASFGRATTAVYSASRGATMIVGGDPHKSESMQFSVCAAALYVLYRNGVFRWARRAAGGVCRWFWRMAIHLCRFMWWWGGFATIEAGDAHSPVTMVADTAGGAPDDDIKPTATPHPSHASRSHHGCRHRR
jgi:hypothetical protein